MTHREYDCPDCRDTGAVSDWAADTENGLRACTREGCYVTEERAEQAELCATYARLSERRALVELAKCDGRFVGAYRVDVEPGHDMRAAAHAKAVEEAAGYGARLVRFEAESAHG